MSANFLQEFSRILQVGPDGARCSLLTKERLPRLYWLSWEASVLKFPGVSVGPKADYDFAEAVKVPEAPASSGVSPECSRVSSEGPFGMFLQRHEGAAPCNPVSLPSRLEAVQEWPQDRRGYPPH